MRAGKHGCQNTAYSMAQPERWSKELLLTRRVGVTDRRSLFVLGPEDGQTREGSLWAHLQRLREDTDASSRSCFGLKFPNGVTLLGILRKYCVPAPMTEPELLTSTMD